MINDLLIEPDSLRVHGDGEVSVGVRMPWYRAVPLSCVVDAVLTVDGVAVTDHTLSVEGRTYRPEELAEVTEDAWFPTDTLTVRGRLDVAADAEHGVRVDLRMHIPYIITAHGVLLIEESRETTMTAREATEVPA